MMAHNGRLISQFREAGFLFETEAPNPTRNLISVLGNEQNGVFFM